MLSIASQNQGFSSAPKRYSLKTGPPKKDVRVKGVNSSAVQAFLKKQAMDQKHKDLQNKKAKEDLLAKRVELKSDRKARAMASRTKDNFRGYNGIPVVEQPKKRQSKGGRSEEQETSVADDEDSFDYEGTDSESDEPSRPVKPHPRADCSNKVDVKHKKRSAPARPAPPPMNFADLLKLAQRKQFEPVELKVVKKTEERLRTAEEIRELEIERKVKKQDRGKDVKLDRNLGQRDGRSDSNSSSQKKTVDGDNRNGKLAKPAAAKYSSSDTGTKPKPQSSSERTHGSVKPHGDRTNSGSSGALNGKVAIKNSASFQAKQAPPRPSQGQRPTTSSDLTSKKGNSSGPQGKTSISGIRSGASSDAARSGQGHPKISGQVRPGQSNSDRGGHPQKQGKPGTTQRPGSGAPPRPGSNGVVQPYSSLKQQRPSGSLQGQQIPGGSRGSLNGPGQRGGGVSGRPVNGMGSGPGRPQCTVVSETICTKNFAPRPGMAQRPPGPQGPRTVIAPTGHRILARPSGPALPPITSSYKRKYEDEDDEYDSEMDDFIDNEGEDQNEISKHIREIFGYDKNKYKDESDYALKFMESSWKEQQKEEARSLRMAVVEDQEEERQELEEMQRKMAKKRKI